MQTKVPFNSEKISDDVLIPILEKAHLGDNLAKIEIINIFEDAIDKMCRYVKLPKEDVKQTLICELLYFIQFNI